MADEAPGAKKLRLAIDNAPELAPAQESEDEGEKGGGGSLPADCPVVPLGMSADASMFYFLDPVGRLVTRPENKLMRGGIVALFNERNPILEDLWPRKRAIKRKGQIIDWEVIGVDWDQATRDLITACGRRGTLNIADRVRGPGAWRGSEDQLIVHCGDRVLIGNRWHRPGELDGKIYTSHPPTPLPSDLIATGGKGGPAYAALELFRAWQWHRPNVAPHLLLGALGAAKLGGALKWRPTTWITGDFGSGKSTLLDYFAGLCGEGGVHQTVDATPAGVWQRTQHSSHPVLIDEAEAENDPRRMAGMIRLARAASSSGVIYRGGSEHAPVQFTIAGCFVFSSILVPGLTPQDKSRITLLELDPLTGIKPPALTPKKLDEMGRALTRRLVDNWTRLQQVYEQYRQALAEHGHRARSADQYGILLACAHVMLHDDALPESDYLEHWCDLLPPERDAIKDHDNCLAHLMTAPIEPFRGGGRKPISQWIVDALQPEPAQPADANKALETYGLKVTLEPAPGGGSEPLRWLYIANTHRGLAQLFEGSHWAGQSGTTAPWVQALRRYPLAEAVEKTRFAGYGARATRLPLPLIDSE